MTVKEFIAKAIAFIALVRAGGSTLPVLSAAIWELIFALIAGLTTPVLAMMSNASHQRMASFAMSQTRTIDQLCDEVEACCAQHQGSTTAIGGSHPIIDALLPILMALLAKLIGG